jgi:site-specific DNA recombinase
MKNTPDKIKWFIYARKSSEDKSKQVQSIESQIGVLKEFAKKHDLDVIDILFEEKSGKTPGIRPVFAKMIARIEAGEATGLLVWKLDRIARNLLDGGRVIDMLQNSVIEEIRTPEETHRPTDNVYSIAIQLCGANQYSRDLSTNVKRGLKDKLTKGWMPSIAPLGYLNTKTEIRGENYILNDPDRFPLLRKAWDMMLTGNYVPTEILHKLNDEWGFRTRGWKKKGGKPMSRSTIYKMFTNAFYAGIIPYKDLYIEGKHPVMITLEEFDRVQLLLGRKGKPRPSRYEYAYTGQILCGECTGVVSATFKQKLMKKTGKLQDYILYYCTCARREGEGCLQRHYTNEGKIDERIEQEIETLTILPEFKDWALAIIAEMNDEEIDDRTKIYESQQKAINNNQKQLDNLTQLRLRELIEDEEYLRERTRLKNELTVLHAKMKGTEQRAESWLKLTEQTFEFACYAHKAFMFGDAKTKREILSAIVGLNCTLKDHLLNIKAVEWLVPIKEKYPAMEAKYEALEPEKYQDPQGRKELFDLFRPEMRGRPDLNRQPSP